MTARPDSLPFAADEPEVNERILTPPASDPHLAAAIEAWRARLTVAGVVCSAVVIASDDPQWTIGFSPGFDARSALWSDLRARVSAENPVALARLGDAAASDLLMATSLRLPNGQDGIVGAVLAPPHNERTIQLVLLSLGWLQLELLATRLTHNERALRLLDLLAHAASQRGARAATQEWIDRSAAWVRNDAPVLADLTLILFEVHHGVPRWWVSADAAWAETGSPEVQAAAEIAARATVELHEVRDGAFWALPMLADGEPVAVLVTRSLAADWPPLALDVLRGSLALAEPLLRHWREADRSLPRHTLAAARSAWRKLTGAGHLTWKFGALVAAAVLALILLWPVADRVTASVVIEGRVRQVITAPFEGFIAQVLVRPGERVTQGQILARLDDRELKLELRRYRSEAEQAAGKLRQAMAEHDAAAMALAAAQLHESEAQLALVQSRLDRSALTAPIDGLVVSGDWAQQIGAPVEIGKEMFEIAATDAYRVVLHVPERDIARLTNGQGGSLRLTGQPHASYGFRVSNVTATASVEDGNNGFRVEAEWEGSAPPLSPGMQGVGKVVVGEANLLTVWTRTSIDWLWLKLWSWGA